MQKIQVYLDENRTVVGYSAGELTSTSMEVFQDEPIIDIAKLSGYKIESRMDGQHLIFDEALFDAVVKENEKTESIKDAEKKLEALNELNILASASDEDAYVMRFLYPVWSGESIAYKQNERLIYQNRFYKVLEDHTSQEDWTPDSASSLYVEISDPNVEYPEWRQPTNAENAYKNVDKVMYNGKKYVSIIDANSWSPDAYPAGWKLVEEETEEEPGEESDNGTEENYPEWKQPSGAQDAYSKGDQVSYNGKHYESLIDANTWTPDAYPDGWKEIE